jgi:hypothetical protein
LFRTHVLNLIVIFFFRTKKLQEEFYSIICLEELAKNLNLDLDIVECIFEYWLELLNLPVSKLVEF